MDRDYVERYNVIERYVLGKLSEEEAAAFEDLFVFDEELRGEIDVVEKLVHGVRENVEPKVSKEHDSDVPARAEELNLDDVRSKVPEYVDAGRRRRYALPFSLAANFVLAVAMVSLLVDGGGPSDEPGQLPSHINPPAVHLEVARDGDGAVPRLEIGDGWVTLLVDASLTDVGSVQLRLVDGDGQVVAETGTFENDPGRPWVEWLVERDRLQRGRYRVEFSAAEAATDSPIAFELDVVPPGE